MISSGLKSAAVSARRRMEHEWWQYAQERHGAGAVRASLARADVVMNDGALLVHESLVGAFWT